MAAQWRIVLPSPILKAWLRSIQTLEGKRIENSTRSSCSISSLSGSIPPSPRKTFLSRLKFYSIAWKTANLRCLRSSSGTVSWYSPLSSTKLIHLSSERNYSNFTMKASREKILPNCNSESKATFWMSHSMLLSDFRLIFSKQCQSSILSISSSDINPMFSSGLWENWPLRSCLIIWLLIRNSRGRRD